MISRANILSTIDAAETEFQWCWDVLVSLKTGKNKDAIGQCVLDFQPRLLKGIVEINRAYRAVKKEERRLIGRKNLLSQKWFRRRMAQLKHYREALKDALNVGKSIGDGFAWLFYERDRELIDEHLKHQKQLLLPPGVGGIGERVILEKLQGLGRKFLLYHGITTFLRMGDFTLIDLSTLRVSSVGELKTQSLGDGRFRGTIGFVAGDRSQLPTLTTDENRRSELDAMRPDIRNHLNQQIRAIGKAIAGMVSLTNQSIATSGTFYYEELREVVTRSHSRKFEYTRAGSGLLLGAWRRSRHTLGANALDANGIDHRLADFRENVEQILELNVEGNNLTLGFIGAGESGLAIGSESLPLFWWPVDEAILKDVLFGRVLVLAVFNSVHFSESLRKKGFTFDSENSSLNLQVASNSKLRLRLENLELFHSLIRKSLVTEEAVLNMIERILQKALLAYDGQPTKFLLRPRLVRSSDR